MAIQEIRPIRVEGNVALVALTLGYEAAIDASDAPLAAGVNWHAHIVRRKDGSILSVYARRDEKSGNVRRKVYLHRLIQGDGDGLAVDHIDGDGLNNRRSNLRFATRAQNACNSRAKRGTRSGVKGVYWDRRVSKWVARVIADGKAAHVGSYSTIDDAAQAIAAMRHELHGAFARP